MCGLVPESWPVIALQIKSLCDRVILILICVSFLWSGLSMHSLVQACCRRHYINFCTFAEMGKGKEGYISSGKGLNLPACNHECIDNCKYL